MLINFYLYCKKPGCSEFIYFQVSRDVSDPINDECRLSDQRKKFYGSTCKKCSTETSIDFDKVYNYQILKFINDVNPLEKNNCYCKN